MKLTMTKGLPGSGKSTWAKKQVSLSNGKIKRVNKDDLRAMIDDSIWSKDNEKNILRIRDLTVEHYLSSGFTVIVDDTNLTPNHEDTLRKIAEAAGAEFEIKSFLDVPLATCILRNAQRPNPVPENAIRSMFNSFVRKKPEILTYEPPVRNPDLPDCIIVDIDGTLAHANGRSPYDYTKVLDDVVDESVREIVQRYAVDTDMGPSNTYVIIVSGRDSTCKSETVKWLDQNLIPYDELHMRDPERVDENGNKLKDDLIKEEIYNTWIKDRYNVRFVLDDRDRVVKKWRELGLKVLQVAEGDF